MYEPPDIARNIPSNALSEWYIGASKVCLLPDLNFGDGSQYINPRTAANDGDGVESKVDETTVDHVAKFVNIGSKTAVNGSLLTLSFHVKQEDVIKLYLCSNGQTIRFMPGDLRDVLPVLFNMDYKGNAEWIKQKKIVEQHIGKLQEQLVDVQFTSFQQSYLV